MTAARTTQAILRRITPADGTNIIDLYSPSWITATDEVEGVRYSGFVTFLTATINIKSLSETDIPPIPESALPEEVQQILEQVALLTQFKNMKIYSRFEGQSALEICTLPLFNQNPFYRISLMPFYSGTNNTIDVGRDKRGAGEVLSVQMVDPLQNNDYIMIRGSVIERATWKRPKASVKEIIYSSYQRTVNSSESTVLEGNVKRNNATFVNYSDPPAGANWNDYVIWIKQGTGPGKPVSPRGGSYMINRNNFYSGAVKAVSAQPTLLSVEEGIEV
jgi:hypothetical protein